MCTAAHLICVEKGTFQEEANDCVTTSSRIFCEQSVRVFCFQNQQTMGQYLKLEFSGLFFGLKRSVKAKHNLS